MVEIDVKDLIPAEWNYKTDGTDEQITKLCNSINEDSSAGVVAVREVGDKFEVIDGNHRLKALKKLKWKTAPCENFGDITKAKAITIARRRNHQWFEDNILAYADIFSKDVLKEYSLKELEKFMPESLEQLENIAGLLDFDWGQFSEYNVVFEEKSEEKVERIYKVDTELIEVIEQLISDSKKRIGNEVIRIKEQVEFMLEPDNYNFLKTIALKKNRHKEFNNMLSTNRENNRALKNGV